ncbi:phage major capsid protein [Salininema proteolyticum]|uniref:Phage major capsid protein n=1 Tax=Salininema proteolyticum TaxID=1607685 RepID=A0ABV8TXL4_9ACTN
MTLNSNPSLLPVDFARDVIKQAESSSAVLALSNTRRISTRVQRIPATAALASAYWVGTSANDFTDLKQQTDAQWKGIDLVVEELAALVPIPHAYLKDNSFPIWDEVRPQLVSAMGRAIDSAVLFGVDKPTTWPAHLLADITAAGQTVEAADGADKALLLAESAKTLKQRGFGTNGWACEPGAQWDLTTLRSADGVPIYQTDLAGPLQTGLYGRPLKEVDNGAWDSTAAYYIHGDWSKSIVGIREDIAFTRHDDAIISDSAGNVVFNAMQQDSSIWRAVFRVAWTRANPATRLAPDADKSGDQATTTKFPFAALVPPPPAPLTAMDEAKPASTDPSTAAVEGLAAPPSPRAKRPEWVAFAIASGTSPETAEAMTKAELIAAYT